MEIWITRNDEGTLELHQNKPFLYKQINKTQWVGGDFIGFVFKNIFPEITFENGPKKVEIKLV